jgi:ketosteroid isomerase-like protein
MIKYLALIVFIVFFVACDRETGVEQTGFDLAKGTDLEKRAPDLNKEKKKLLETDQLFSETAKEKGFAGAFALFLSEESRIFQNNFLPIVGKADIVKFMAENVKATITWEPYFVEMSASADLGYTLGKSKSTVTSASGKEIVSYGHYVTIWKKQPDGSWKVVFDSGIQTPE